jgi:hypothetical protein
MYTKKFLKMCFAISLKWDSEIVFQLFKLFHGQARGLYFSVENLMEWVCYVTAILFVFDFDDCSYDTGVRHSWQWQVGAVSITMCWLNLVSAPTPQFSNTYVGEKSTYMYVNK